MNELSDVNSLHSHQRSTLNDSFLQESINPKIGKILVTRQLDDKVVNCSLHAPGVTDSNLDHF